MIGTVSEHRGATTGGRRPGWRALAGVLGVAGALHLVAPAPYDRLIPRRLGAPRPWVYGSGVAEIACAAALVVPRTRRLGALASAALFVGVFPGNVTMAARALRSPRAGAGTRALTLARLPLQAPLVAWALHVAADAARQEDRS
jgi:uncharacterized membrane protein